MTLAKIWRTLGNIIILFVLLVTLQRSDYDSANPVEQVRAYTRWQEFDYASWIADALALKFSFGTLNFPNYIEEEQQRRLVNQHLALLQRLNEVRDQISTIYADPAIKDPEAASAAYQTEQAALTARINRQQPLVEAVIQHQISAIIGDLGLALGGQPLPPLLYHVTPLPMALIVSPRQVIQQVADISVMPDLPLAGITRLEDAVADGLDVSSIIVPVGGVGVYPTMVMRSANLNWLVETIAHEWIHNYLTLRPVGAFYYSAPEMRTINETTANIAGAEIGKAVIRRFYPEYAPAPSLPVPFEDQFPGKPLEETGSPVFDYRAEMHETRITADALLAEGKVEEAEAYMEARRQVFWDNGYRIRKLNQAYFAFYGSYADQPGGAAGIDPVGAAVRILRAQSLSLSDFLDRMAWVTSFESLQGLTEPN
ncbi:MAG TPA: hypothetical protein DCP32_03395 [Anaerolineaceae bacterium]|nr:MAG: hypothetical protein A2X24_09490 [Chloroflexi bacterium GWB2_54_36]HAL15816.1 hypothetical protein [Anaerolineaceae bacterium]